MADAQIQQGNQAATNLSGTPVSQLGVTGDSSIPTTATQNSTSPNVMTPTQAFNNNPIPVPTVQSPSNTSSIVAGAQQTVDQVTQSLTPAPTALDNQQQGLLNDISSLTGEDSGKDQALLNEQNANGATADQTALTSANNELNTKIASYNQLEANVGSGIGGLQASAAYNAQLAGLKTAAAADIGVTQAKITAAQGNLTLALSQAQSAIDARYSTIEDNIKTKQAQLAAIQPQLDTQQKTQALAQQKILQDQADKVAQQKADETTIQGYGLQAATNGAPQGIIQAITNATDPNVALQLATPYLAKAPTQIVEVNGHSLLIDSQTGKTVQDLGVSNSVIQANIAHGGGSTPTSGSIVDPTTDAGVKAIILANPGNGQSGGRNNVLNGQAWDSAAAAIDAKYGAGTATQYDSELKGIYNGGQNVNDAFGSTNLPKLTTSQTVSVRAANTAINNSKTGVAFQNANTAYANIQSIDPNTTNPSLQQQALLNLSQLEFPGTNSARGLLSVNVGSAQNSDFANALISAQKILQAKGSLAPGVIKNLQSQATTIFNNTKSSYDSAVNENAKSLAATLGVSQSQAKQYLTNLDTNSGQSNSGQQTVQSNGQSYIVGQVYNDGTANWTVDAQGNWTKQ